MISSQRIRKIISGLSTIILVELLTYNLPFLNLDRTKVISSLVLLALIDLIFFLYFFRCPNCKKLLSLKYPFQHKCKECGYDIR
ncbi:hypothetical protein [Neofamilia massiliensis]|uniref:hypothetical protein n=1 Tax=Neofamilia massiliensis TaxID=1673724 RepID=UPI0006BB65B7|nr:hypothetical protein [Neofamilia massiliensis]